MFRRLLLACGILAPLLYMAMNAFVPMRFEGYSVLSQSVSELSAIGAPTRSLWIALGIPYGLLLFAFGLGVWLAAGGKGPLRVAGATFMFWAAFGAFWPPMHPRGTEFTLTDKLHIVWAVAVLGFMLVTIAFGAAALGRGFRIYSVVTVVIFVVFGAMPFFTTEAVIAGAPTPLLGVWQRINIAAHAVWMMVFALALMRRERP